jgi:hypothetical protein
MMRRMGNFGSSIGNRLQSMYNNRRGLATTAQNMLGTAKQGIRLLGRTNDFVKRLGVSAPQLNNITSNLERYGNPAIDFVNDELKNVE